MLYDLTVNSSKPKASGTAFSSIIFFILRSTTPGISQDRFPSSTDIFPLSLSCSFSERCLFWISWILHKELGRIQLESLRLTAQHGGHFCCLCVFAFSFICNAVTSGVLEVRITTEFDRWLATTNSFGASKYFLTCLLCDWISQAGSGSQTHIRHVVFLCSYDFRRLRLHWGSKKGRSATCVSACGGTSTLHCI